LKEKHDIREKLHWQILQLFRVHPALPNPVGLDWAGWPDWKWPAVAIEGRQASSSWYVENQCVVQIGPLHFVPLVRSSLDLVCELEILFLRTGRPGVMERGERYDIDNRLLTLFDALALPRGQTHEAYTIAHSTLSAASPIFCLLSDDDRITASSVRTDEV
jgi:hypothetical protein